MNSASEARALLAHLRQRGIILTADGDTLRARPAERIDPDIAARIRRHKPVLLALVQSQAANRPDAENIAEFIQERAAIMEYDGGLPRPKAERAAVVRAVVHFKLIDDQGAGVLIDDEGYESAVRVLREKYGARLESVFSIGEKL